MTEATDPSPTAHEAGILRRKLDRLGQQQAEYPLFNVVLDYFRRGAERRLQGLFGDRVEVVMEAHELGRFDEMHRDPDGTALHCVFEVSEWADMGLIVLSPALTDCVVERLLGNDGESPAAAADTRSWKPTALDCRLAARFAGTVADAFAAVTRDQTPAFRTRLAASAGGPA